MFLDKGILVERFVLPLNWVKLSHWRTTGPRCVRIINLVSRFIKRMLSRDKDRGGGEGWGSQGRGGRLLVSTIP